MGKLGKTCTLILMLMLVMSTLSLLTVKPASAQTMPTPSIPQFTLSFTNSTQYQPPYNRTSSYTNPYTNVTTTNVTTVPGVTISHPEIDVTIKNQQFPSVVDGNSSRIYLDVRIKPHFNDNEWVDQYSFSNFTEQYPGQYYADVSAGTIQWSNATYTVIQIDASSYQPGYEIDVQVQASLGYYYTYSAVQNLHVFSVESFFAQPSGWSNTQTINIPASSTSPTSTPAVPELSWLVVMPLLLSVFFVAVVAVMARHRKKSRLSVSQAVKPLV